MANLNAIAAVRRIGGHTGVPVALSPAGVLTVQGQVVHLPEKLTGERADLFGIDGLFPTVARGDDRDKLLWGVIADARPGEGTTDLLLDRDLEQELAGRLGMTGQAAAASAAALEDRFFNNKKVRALLPVHASLPLNYVHTTKAGVPARYRMFNGGILPFLLWDADTDAVDAGLVKQLLTLISDDSQLTNLDRLFLRVALDGAPNKDLLPEAQVLIERYEETLRSQLGRAGGPFCEPSLLLFRKDLATVLSTKLPRPDKIAWLTLLLSLHLTVRLYRIAVVKGMQLDLAVAAGGQLPAPFGARSCSCAAGGGEACLLSCPLAGLLRFRIGTGRYRPASVRDGSRASFVEIDQQRLLDMPATLITATLASRAWAALGGGEAAGRRDLDALQRALQADPGLRTAHGAACAAIAVLHHVASPKGSSDLDELAELSTIGPNRPGLHLLREDVRKMRRSDLRHQSRDIVNQLMLDANVAGPGSLISRNGTRGFYEIDEQLLLLLARIVCRGEPVPFDSFIEGLRCYGIEPQDSDEVTALEDTLERLGLLNRYSDSGDASYVQS